MICTEGVRPRKTTAGRGPLCAQRRCLLKSLPTAGYRNCNGSVNNVGSNGNYWSSTPKDSDYAWGLYFYFGRVHMDYSYRRDGISVRLVKNKMQDDDRKAGET